VVNALRQRGVCICSHQVAYLGHENVHSYMKFFLGQRNKKVIEAL
jgi:hypothetical protein